MSEERRVPYLAPSVIEEETTEYITVVTVGTEDASENEVNESSNPEDDTSKSEDSGYVTVLQIGDTKPSSNEIVEEVLVYRLPGERLGFGLKFEGGTKAAENVKRLFIQSCAPDSPASMVHCSWGKLTEGDEVLNIDSLPVTRMTRIDCVRCLKDSNVVIKLLVKHLINKKVGDDCANNDISARLSEDLPHVISAEKKRTPPPPPPVPPRKIPRKLLKENIPVSVNTPPIDNDVPTPNHVSETNGIRLSRFQSPRNSGKFGSVRQSPEISKHIYKDRRLSDGSVGPPDAEVYLDLFSQESGCNLSESDDTGSSISTIIDRFSSYPTTTNSSLAGSLPSTPTSIQKQLIDRSYILNSLNNDDLDAISNDNYLFKKFSVSQEDIDETDCFIRNYDETFGSKRNKNNRDLNEDETPLQPPTSFQDAPLSYGTEKVSVVDAKINSSIIKKNKKNLLEMEDENGNCLKELIIQSNEKQFCSNQIINETNDIEKKFEKKENLQNGVELPRLVHLLPKSASLSVSDEDLADTVSSLKFFLDNETRFSEELLTMPKNELYDDESASQMEEIYNNSDIYNHTWNLHSQLATIGEVDEEGCQDSYFHQKSIRASTPLVIIENADAEKCELDKSKVSELVDTPNSTGTDIMHDVDQIKDMKKQMQADATSDSIETMDFPSKSSSNRLSDNNEFWSCNRNVPKIDNYKNAVLPTNSGLWKTSTSCLLFRDQQSACSFRDKIAFFNTPSNDLLNQITSKSSDDILNTIEKDNIGRSNSCIDTKSKYGNTKEKLSNTSSMSRAKSSLDLHLQTDCAQFSSDNDATAPTSGEPSARLHTRSKSLLDISSSSEKLVKKDRWNLLTEQRQKSLSKLKGLVIPERVVEIDSCDTIDLPEITNKDISLVLTLNLPKEVPRKNLQSNEINSISGLTNNKSNSISTYSPTFKQKNLTNGLPLQQDKIKENGFVENFKKTANLDLNDTHDTILSIETISPDAPKSLESLTSPTRSDCSFEFKFSKTQKNNQMDTKIRLGNFKKSEDESDNDSAVSSSQSSYISRTSPPMSPKPHIFNLETCNNEQEGLTQLKCDLTGFQPHSQLTDNQNHRLLKPQSVEAINRKNILASAKRRSGKDLIGGSPLIKKKFEQEEFDTTIETNDSCSVDESEPLEIETKTNNSKPEIIQVVKPVHAPTIEKENRLIACKIETNEQENTKSPLKKNKEVQKTNDLKISDLLSKSYLQKNSPLKPLSRHSSASVTDLRRTFEKLAPVNTNTKTIETNSSAIKKKEVDYKPLPVVVGDSKLSNDIKLESKISNGKEISEFIILTPQIPGGSVGITLAGGSDYEIKEVTVYKIRNESSAHRDGRLKKSDQILSINNKPVEGLTHKELVALLKEPLPQVTLEVCKNKNKCDLKPAASIRKTKSCVDLTSKPEKEVSKLPATEKTFVVSLVKDSTGLGLSLEGGQDSPLGNKPLQIKKLFKGGVAEKCENLKVGDQLSMINDVDVSSMSRFQAWSVLKKLPEGVPISLTIKR